MSAITCEISSERIPCMTLGRDDMRDLSHSKGCMERILVTGATGFVGSNVVRWAEDKYEVIPTSHHPFDALNYSLTVMDVGSKEDCQKVINAAKPELVVHCAAYLDLVGCEIKNAQARTVNLDGTINVAKACKSVGAFLVYVSTDWVFDGTNPLGQLYSESDPPCRLMVTAS